MNAIEKYGPTIQGIEKFTLQLDVSIRSEAFRFLLAREFADEVGTQRALPLPETKTASAARGLSPQELLRKVEVQTMSDTATVLGYWLEMHQGEASFSSGRLKEAFDIARENPPVNPSDVVAKLEAAGKLMRADKVGSTQHYKLTRTAIDEIEQKVGQPSEPAAPANPDSKITANIVILPGEGVSDRASIWMRQNQISREQLDQIFSIEMNPVELIAPSLPGDSKRKQAVQAYIMCGMCSFIRSGELTFTDANARALCERIGCFDSGNHTNVIRAFGNLITGSKDAGWRLTNPGLSEAAKIIKQLTPS